MKIKMVLTMLAMYCIAAPVIAPARTKAAANIAPQDKRARQYVQGTVIGIGGRFGGRSRPFNLTINRLTSPDQVEQLKAAIHSGGQDELLRALSKMDAGQISIGTGVGVTANAVIATTTETGSRLTVIYQRNINFYELRYGRRSENYRFGYAEILLDRNGKGQGTFIPAAQIRLKDDGTWEVEDFGVYPARILGVQVRT